MYHGAQRGWIEIIAGVMFSGKNEELIRRVCSATIARNRVQVFKSRLDDRHGNGSAVLSHDGTILVGGRESYEARCRHCHVVPRADAAQTKLPLSS